MVIFSTFITILTSTYQLYWNFDRDVKGIEGRLDEVRQVHLHTLVDRVWISDREELIHQLEGIQNVPDIAYLEILEQGAVTASVGAPLQERVLKRTYPLIREYHGNGIQIGVLNIQASKERAYQHIFDQVWSILISNGVKTFFVAGFLLYLVHYLVTRHLFRIAEFVGAYDLHHSDTKIALDRQESDLKKQDELDIVVNSFENMQHNIQQSVKSLREKEVFIRLLMDSTVEAIYGIDNNGCCTFANSSCLTMLGYGREEELLGRNMHQLIHNSCENKTPYPESDGGIYKSVRTKSGFYSDSEEFWRTDGTSFAVEYRSYPIIEDGEVSGAVVTFTDITERVNAQREQNRLLSIIDSAIDFMAITTLDGEFLFKNTSAKLMLNSQDSPIKNLSSIFALTSQGLFHRRIVQQVEKLSSWSGKCHIAVYNSDKTIPVFMDIIQITDADSGEPTHLAVVARDITEINRTENELREHHDNLEMLVEKRTAALADSVDELESFSYSVSHDLRGPLRSINGFSLALAEEYAHLLDSTGKDYLTRVRAATDRMAKLIDDLLQLAQVSRTEMEFKPLDLSKVAHEVSEVLQVSNQGRKVNMSVDEDMTVQGDAGLLRIVIENLLDNAWKYTSTISESSVKVGKIKKDDKLVYYVKDNGVGFDMRYHDKIFGPFERLHKDGEFEGTGIGLATVKRVIKRHGGMIWAEAEEGLGAVFYFTIN